MRILVEYFGVRSQAYLPHLSERQILKWADAYHARHGKWPSHYAGPIDGAPGETWNIVETALSRGCRGLPGGSSLARLLVRERGMRHAFAVPPLTEQAILQWADAHHASRGTWPKQHSGPVAAGPGETWTAIDLALRVGRRGLPGGSSLARLLADRRGVRNQCGMPPLTTQRILAWADKHFAQHGCWPGKNSGQILGAPNESWCGIDKSLSRGRRGLPGGSSLASLLQRHRGVRNRRALPPLTTHQILAWADQHYAQLGGWPVHKSGCLLGEANETWSAIDSALQSGSRSLPGNSSLARLLASERGVRNQTVVLQPLSVKQILAWVDKYYDQHGRWPQRNSGQVPDAPNETWWGIDASLRSGRRGLPGGSSLARLLSRRRGVRNPQELPPLSINQILAWADQYYAQHGRWPGRMCGQVAGTHNENWLSIDSSLRLGLRGLEGGITLFRLLKRHRGAKRAKPMRVQGESVRPKAEG